MEGNQAPYDRYYIRRATSCVTAEKQNDGGNDLQNGKLTFRSSREVLEITVLERRGFSCGLGTAGPWGHFSGLYGVFLCRVHFQMFLENLNFLSQLFLFNPQITHSSSP